jgi:hypothetical protein
LEFLGCQAKTINFKGRIIERGVTRTKDYNVGVMFKLKNAPFIGYSQYKGFTLLLFLEYI